jgi:hypothetical protein
MPMLDVLLDRLIARESNPAISPRETPTNQPILTAFCKTFTKFKNKSCFVFAML